MKVKSGNNQPHQINGVVSGTQIANGPSNGTQEQIPMVSAFQF
jgi:hypothetical protein